MAEFRINVVVDPARAQRGADQVGRSLDRTAQRADRLRTAIRRAVGVLSGAAVAAFVSGSIRLATTQAQALAQVERGIRNLGEGSGLTIDRLAAFASELQNVTTVGDETTLGLISMILTFRRIDPRNIERTTAAVLDLAEASNTDLRSAAFSLAKALEDPESRLGDLSRSGTVFADSLREQIVEAQRAGDTFRAQGLILEELEAQYGGAAEAARGVFGGALRALANRYGDVREIIGEGSESASEAILNLERTLNGPEVREAAAFLGRIVAGAIERIANALAFVSRNIKEIAISIGVVLLPLAPVFSLVVAGITSVAVAIDKSIEAFRRLDKVIGEIPTTWGDVAKVAADEFANGVIGGIVAIARAIPNLLRLIIDPVVTTYGELARQLPDIIKGNITLEQARQTAAFFRDQVYNAALEELRNDFSEDLDRRYVDFAGDEARQRVEELRQRLPPDEAAVELPPIAVEGQALPGGPQIPEIEFGQADDFQRIADRLDPISAALRKVAEEQEILDAALQHGEITMERHAELSDRLSDSYRDQINPLQALYRELERNDRLLAQGIQERRVTTAFERAQQDLRRKGVELSAMEARALRGRITAATAVQRQLRLERRIYRDLQSPLAEYTEQMEALARVLALHPELARQAAEAQRELRLELLDSQTDLASGIERGLIRISESANDTATQIEGAITQAFRGAEDAIVQFVQTGSLRFGDLVQSILADLARLTIQQSITGPLASALGGILGGAFGGGGSSAATSSAAATIGAFAQGGAVEKSAHVSTLLPTITQVFKSGGPIEKTAHVSTFSIPSYASGGHVEKSAHMSTLLPSHVQVLKSGGPVEKSAHVSTLRTTEVQILKSGGPVEKSAHMSTLLPTMTQAFNSGGIVEKSAHVSTLRPYRTASGGPIEKSAHVSTFSERIIEKLPVYATGGIVRGPGTPTSDSIGALLSPGSFVVNAASTTKHRGLLDSMMMADGGLVPARISTGEYVVPPAVARTYAPVLTAINADAPKYLSGGVVTRNDREASGVSIVVNDRRGSDSPPPEISERRGAGGSRLIELTVREAVRAGIRRGDFDRDLNSNFGLRRSLS